MARIAVLLAVLVALLAVFGESSWGGRERLFANGSPLPVLIRSAPARPVASQHTPRAVACPPAHAPAYIVVGWGWWVGRARARVSRGAREREIRFFPPKPSGGAV
jgi:hypothetical protein